MPIYSFKCPFDHVYSAYQGLTKDFKYEGEDPYCPDHFVPGARMVNMPMLNGASPQSYKTDEATKTQLGRTFSSAKEHDEWCKANGKILTDERGMKDLQKNKKDVTQTKEYQKSKQELYQEINSHGGVQHPDGSVTTIDDHGRWKKVKGT